MTFNPLLRQQPLLFVAVSPIVSTLYVLNCFVDLLAPGTRFAVRAEVAFAGFFVSEAALKVFLLSSKHIRHARKQPAVVAYVAFDVAAAAIAVAACALRLRPSLYDRKLLAGVKGVLILFIF